MRATPTFPDVIRGMSTGGKRCAFLLSTLLPAGREAEQVEDAGVWLPARAVQAGQ